MCAHDDLSSREWWAQDRAREELRPRVPEVASAGYSYVPGSPSRQQRQLQGPEGLPARSAAGLASEAKTDKVLGCTTNGRKDWGGLGVAPAFALTCFTTKSAFGVAFFPVRMKSS